MPPVGFEPTIAVGERPQTFALDRAVTGTGDIQYWSDKIMPLHTNVHSYFTNYFVIIRYKYNLLIMHREVIGIDGEKSFETRIRLC